MRSFYTQETNFEPLCHSLDNAEKTRKYTHIFLYIEFHPFLNL